MGGNKSLSKHIRWDGSYQELRFEISFWGEGVMNESKGMWNYYLLIPEQILARADFETLWLSPQKTRYLKGGQEHILYNYYNSPLCDLDWHGEITFYTKNGGLDGAKRWIKVGCDYGHLFDQERCSPYTLESVTEDAIATTKKFAARFRLKRKCSWNGKWIFPENGEVHNGKFYSPAGWREFNKKHPKISEQMEETNA